MNEFDIKAKEWDQNPMHFARSEAVISSLLKNIKPDRTKPALEYGAGTGISGFLIREHFREIIMMDSSAGMVKIINEKILANNYPEIKAVEFNLEKEKWGKGDFGLILTQMVLHHVNDVSSLLKKFTEMLSPGGYLAIADLYTEDGSFHGEGFTGHKGFDPVKLGEELGIYGLAVRHTEKCFTIRKLTGADTYKDFDIFLLIAKKKTI
jgi:ubiquinone/menaquinone biosynthesis C-methylase UbiE